LSKIQHKLAHDLLTLIKKATTSYRLLTYKSAAIALGKSGNHARAVAQACDLLDAAAALAHIPLLALVAVRDSSFEINPKAWKEVEQQGTREAIINCSLNHKFTEEDFAAIRQSLIVLAGFGNRRAWAKVKITIPQDQLLTQLTATSQIQSQRQNQDAVNDIGADIVDQETRLVTRYSRDPYVRKAAEERAKGKCEYCGKEGFKCSNGTRYLETHHIIALSKDGADRLSNVIALCPDDHREAHYGALKEKIEADMIAIVKRLCR
jgi:5-methylcytosine-specific restriction endonuclease McrA